MTTKKCSNCKEEKDIGEFLKYSKSKDGFGYRCIPCRRLEKQSRADKIKAYNKQYRIDNREKRRLYNIEYVSKNREIVALAAKKYRAENAEKIRLASKEYNSKLENKERMNARARERWASNKKDYLRKKEYRQKNKEKYAEYARNHFKKNKEVITERHKQRMKTDPVYALKRKIHDAIKNSIERKGYSKTSRTAEILGCSYEFFIGYIEAQFVKGMTWDNISIDHIKPKKTANTLEEVILLNHYTNLQPLFMEDNIKKGAKLITKQLRLL
jgi:hypothetical protein